MGDYAKKTAALSLAEHGAYSLLLDEYYSTETPLPAEHEALFRLCRAMTAIEQDAVRSVADRFFKVEEDGLRHNERADEEIAKAQATIAKQRESGAESARKRWSTDKSTDGSTHESTDGLSGRSAIQPPSSNSNTKPKTSCASRFDEFWVSYPRKKSKGAAEKAWLKINPDEQLHDRILDAIEQAKTSEDWQSYGGKFIPYPASWLNARGWEDELSPAAAPAFVPDV
jgi:uncharacterized protein YdaU (DUF1376 family)